jgi:hypothetical protein
MAGMATRSIQMNHNLKKWYRQEVKLNLRMGSRRMGSCLVVGNQLEGSFLEVVGYSHQLWVADLLVLVVHLLVLVVHLLVLVVHLLVLVVHLLVLVAHLLVMVLVVEHLHRNLGIRFCRIPR